MYSIGEAVRRLGCSDPWVRKWVRLLGLGQKVGWAVVLSPDDIEQLEKKKATLNGNQKAA